MPDFLSAHLQRTRIAYYSMEIALGPEMHTYSGGLGVLAGDFALAAADLRLPMVFVTLISRKGYLRQTIDDAGRQTEAQDSWDPTATCRQLPLKLALELEGRDVWIRPWLYELKSPSGDAVPVILLDTALVENEPDDRALTDFLYGGDARYRLKQEAVLGIGGLRILEALGFHVERHHLNEGHAALLTIELLRREHREPADGGSEPGYFEAHPVLGRCIFTTHTPVEAGHDAFSYGLVKEVLGEVIDHRELARHAGAETCNLTRLALNLSGYVNGVAQRHARTTRELFPGHQISAITNGIHPANWVHPSFAAVFDRAFANWRLEPELLAQADLLPADQITGAKAAAKAALIGLTRELTGASLDPALPIIAYARRMTGYKRPLLLFHEVDRLREIARDHPFQVIWAGKAHPRDEPGKAAIAAIHDQSIRLGSAVPMVYLPGYSTAVARVLCAGADIWLNTPLPPLEASGTSGMKAAVNGTLNLSVLDGWWIEGWVEDVTGWAIGTDGDGAAGAAHAESLYRKLEQRILPMYAADMAKWTWMMQQAISRIAPIFNSHRVMRRYATDAYFR